jgi:VWFA-related protein
VQQIFTALLVVLIGWPVAAKAIVAAPGQDPLPVFSSTVDRVTVNATVRTRKGRGVAGLAAKDFVVLDSGQPVKIDEFRSEAGPVSLALLVDFSGSMDVASRRQVVKENVGHLLAWLKPDSDEAGLYVFDKELRELQPMAPAPGNILSQLDAAARPFGATSLFDAIAETSRRIAAKKGPRTAVVALTDGADNASRLSAEEVSALASSIDVPVYVLVMISPFDRSGKTTVDDERLLTQAQSGPLGNLARWTGGEILIGLGPAQSSLAARQIVTELRQQYLLAFEPGTRPGWHPLEVRTTDEDHIVRARSGYIVTGRPAGW